MNNDLTILNKNSASPTLIVVVGGKVIKLWLTPSIDPPRKEDYNEYEYDDEYEEWSASRGLDYELISYKSIITPLVQESPDVSIMKFHGGFINNNFGVFTEHLYKKGLSKSDMQYLYSAFNTYSSNVNERIKYATKKAQFIKSWKDKGDENSLALSRVLNIKKISGIILPYVENNHTLTDVIKRSRFEVAMKILLHVCVGIKKLHDNNVTHNDLHSDNILITENGFPLIYDWDRAYIPVMGYNPQLTADCSTGLCAYSNCNIDVREYSIDFFKIFSYFARRDDFAKFLDMVQVPDRTRDIRNIRESFQILNEGFFNVRGKTILQCPDSTMKHLIRLFGINLDTIIRRMTRNFSRLRRESLSFGFSQIEKREMSDISNRMMDPVDKTETTRAIDEFSINDAMTYISNMGDPFEPTDIEELASTARSNAEIFNESYSMSEPPSKRSRKDPFVKN